MFGFAENYIIPFAVLFGASAFQVSLITATSQLGIAVGQLSGAKFIQNYKKRKTLSLICVSIHALSWLGVFYGTWLTKSVWVILIFFGVGFLAGNFSAPGWVSWMNDLVPPNLRGRFWGFRNRASGFTQFAAITVGGVLLFFAAKGKWEIIAFGILFTFAAVARALCTRPLSKQYEPPMTVAEKSQEFRFTVFLKKLGTTNFGRFALFSFFMTFSVNIMGPLVSVHLLKSLHFNYIQYMGVMMAAIVFSFIAMNYWGPLTDKYGNYRILTATAIFLPIIPVGFVVFQSAPYLILVQIFSGFVWAGFNLSTANFIYDAVRKENISKIIAYFNTLNNIAAFCGSLTGGALTRVTRHFVIAGFAEGNYELIFSLSAFLRIIIIMIFIRGFKEVREVEKSPGFEHFYIYQPVTNIINRFGSLTGRRRRGREGEK